MAAESIQSAENENGAITPQPPNNEEKNYGDDIPITQAQTEFESNQDNIINNSGEISDLEDEELYPLMNDKLSDDEYGETLADVSFAKTKKQEVMIMNIIQNVKDSGDVNLDLSQKNLQNLPEEIFCLTNIEYMFLEGNDIAFLPDEFFKFFPSLRWLDLRNNQLSRIPSFFLSNHQFLRDLLLEGNNLRDLPLELGLVRSLHGLNIACNPLDFPPQDIIDKGTQHILGFLRSMIDAKNTAKMADLGELSLSEDVSDGFEHISASSDDWNTAASMMELAKRREAAGTQGFSADHTPVNVNQCHEEEEYPIGARSAELHRPARHSENKYKHFQKLKKAGALGVIDKKKRKSGGSNKSWKVNPYPAPPDQDYAAFKMNEEKQMARVKDFKQKTEAILQRRKDETQLQNWRDESKVLQQMKYRQRMEPGKDYEHPTEQAPFGVEKDRMRVLSKEERIKDDVKREKEIKDARSLSPATRQRIEAEKQSRIRDLEKRIKEHTSGMVERRKQPKGTPQVEMEIARRELEMVKNLQRDLMRRYQELKTWTSG